MRSTTRSIIAICILGSASPALAQTPDSGVPDQTEAEKEPPKKERSRLVQPDGEEADNEQLGGEPSLTEVRESQTKTETPTEDEGGPSAQPKEEDCDLDCIEDIRLITEMNTIYPEAVPVGRQPSIFDSA